MATPIEPAAQTADVRSGFPPATACSSLREAVVHCLDRDRFRAVILDSSMPRYDALLRGLTDPPGRARPKIIFAANDAEARHEYAGVDFVVTKPFQIEQVDAAIAACCVS